jgi:hypothetical protein
MCVMSEGDSAALSPTTTLRFTGRFETAPRTKPPQGPLAQERLILDRRAPRRCSATSVVRQGARQGRVLGALAARCRSGPDVLVRARRSSGQREAVLLLAADHPGSAPPPRCDCLLVSAYAPRACQGLASGSRPATPPLSFGCQRMGHGHAEV